LQVSFKNESRNQILNGVLLFISAEVGVPERRGVVSDQPRKKLKQIPTEIL
jgi:hypothetical protein